MNIEQLKNNNNIHIHHRDKSYVIPFREILLNCTRNYFSSRVEYYIYVFLSTLNLTVLYFYDSTISCSVSWLRLIYTSSL